MEAFVWVMRLPSRRFRVGREATCEYTDREAMEAFVWVVQLPPRLCSPLLHARAIYA